MPQNVLFIFGTRLEPIKLCPVTKVGQPLDDPAVYQQMARRHDPYRNSRASGMIAALLAARLTLAPLAAV